MLSASTRSRLHDPDLPGVEALNSATVPAPLTTAYATVGTTIEDAALISVTWWPGRQLTIQYRVDGHDGELPGTSHAVVTAGGADAGPFLVAGEEASFGVWILPNDPALPGLRSALDLTTVNELLAGLGASEVATSVRLRAYRPGRRAVVQVEAGASSVFLKVVPPSGVDRLHDSHRHLASGLPVPDSLGVSRELGIMAMHALPGADLRNVMRQGGDIPPWTQIPPVLAALPAPRSEHETRSPFRTVPRVVDLLSRLAPGRRPELDLLTERLGEESVEATTASHGDFHEAQLMVSASRIVGVVDVDTFGWGRPGDDPATMLAHLDLLAVECVRPHRIRQYALALNRHWDTQLDPADLRRRVAAVILGLAIGPFRVQRPRWPDEVNDRIDAALRWADSADRIDERSLIPTTGASHGGVRR